MHIRLEGLQRHNKDLELRVNEVMCLRRDRDDLKRKGAESSSEATRLEKEVAEWRSKASTLEEQLLDVQGRERNQNLELDKLRTQVKQLNYEKLQAARSRSGLVEREGVWEMREGDLMSTICDLQRGLGEQSRHSDGLGEQLNSVEARCEQLEDLLQRFAPAELQLLNARGSDARRPATFLPSAQCEAVQLRLENRRLQAALAEQRLRNADSARQLAQLSSRLRHVERGESDRKPCPTVPLSEEGVPEGTVSEVAPQPEATAASASHSQPDDRRRTAGDAWPCDAEQSSDSTPVTGTAVADLASGRRRGAPRSSILKKPKLMPNTCDNLDKENRWMNVSRNDSLRSRDVVKPKRIGIVGSGLSRA